MFGTKAEEGFVVVVAICFIKAYFYSPCQHYIPKPIAHLFMCKCAFSLKVEVFDK